MGRNWAIAIGINKYQFLQPLKYAQRDAELMQNFFGHEAGFEKIFFFSDNSPDIGGKSTLPNRANLRRFLRELFERPFLGVGDNCWFFFSGHGMRHAEKDYLMPIDGDPDDIENTAIEINFVTERLRRCGADNVVLLLDACRSEGIKSGEGIGRQTAEQTRQLGVISIFSCSPQQYSYEIETLQQGVFTKVLLDGLRIQGEGNCATVERLYQYLSYKVPEINRLHLKPLQTPYVIAEPATKLHLILLPRYIQPTLNDIATLKMDAQNAELEKDIELANQLWIRVLVVSPGDIYAVNAIQRLARMSPNEGVLKPPINQTGNKSGREKVLNPGLLPIHISRRGFLQTTGLVVGGVTVAVIGQNLFNNQNKNLTSKNQTSVNTPTPEITTSSQPTPTAKNTPPVNNLKTFDFEVVKTDAKGSIINRRNATANYFEEDLGKGVKLQMVEIPGGKFLMGSPESEKNRESNESPQHQVTVPSFFMARYQLTQAQYQAIIGTNPSYFKGNNRPVEQVSWDDAAKFCQSLSQKTGKSYRLPSEAEWEYACRAGTTTPFYFGESITPDVVNYNGDYPYASAPKGQYRQQTTDVGTFPPNAFGLYDMHGNVYEWCLDDYKENYINAPINSSALTSPDANYKLLRGGSWYDIARYCRSADRGRYSRDSRSLNVGFRVVVVART